MSIISFVGVYLKKRMYQCTKTTIVPYTIYMVHKSINMSKCQCLENLKFVDIYYRLLFKRLINSQKCTFNKSRKIEVLTLNF